ncbi:hypothetical protein Hanom_Chr14g01284051 [Helianthus anomalus]
MKPIKSNQLLNQSTLLDLAEIKSQPLKLIKITSRMAVQSSFLWFSWWLPPPFPAHHLHNSTFL